MTTKLSTQGKTLSEIRAEAGRLGGRANVQNNGSAHMARIGLEGARVTHSTYRLEPMFQNDFALVHRETNQIVAFLSGRTVEEWMNEPERVQ
jgi:hypothetical protein